MKSKSVVFLLSLVMVLALLLSGCQVPPEESVTTPPTESSAEWQVYHDDLYGFRLAYPADWQVAVQGMGGPGMPDDWPVKASAIFFPDALAEALNQQGPPDPNAPPAVPPFSVEVFAGPLEQFRRAYPEPGRTDEALEVNGATLVVERDTNDDYNIVRYVFIHPQDPEVRVVLVDVISGFSQRAAANPEYLEVIARVVASLEFTGEQPPARDAQLYIPVTLPEAGLSLEVPADWQQRADAPIWQPVGSELPRVGVAWVDLQPPQEAEPALLPQGAQILESVAVDLTWAQGRSFTLEVYAADAPGGDVQAQVATVEQHLIVVIELESGRRAYDFYAIGDSPEQLASIQPVYQHLLDSLALQDADAQTWYNGSVTAFVAGEP